MVTFMSSAWKSYCKICNENKELSDELNEEITGIFNMPDGSGIERQKTVSASFIIEYKKMMDSVSIFDIALAKTAAAGSGTPPERFAV